jgi:hypothetical protein
MGTFIIQTLIIGESFIEIIDYISTSAYPYYDFQTN